MTQTNDELTQILSNALNSNQSIRKSAEDSINQLACENIGYFLLNLSMKISNENIPKGIRQISATIIKNMIKNAKYSNQWKSLDNEIKQKIKQHVLSTLASSDNDIRKSAGLAIAGICHVDLPNKEWLDIFGILVDTSQNDDLSIQLASVTTLGYIFEEISLEDIQQSDIAKILNGFFTILNKDTSDILLVEYTLTAIHNFSLFLSVIITVEEQKFILFDLIKKFIMHSSEKIRLIAIKIFIEFLKNYYDEFTKYIETVIEFTAVIMEKDNEENSTTCYFLWITIAMKEINRITKMKGNKQSKFYCQLASPRLIPIMLNHLITNNYRTEDWNKSKAASLLISLFSQCIEYSLIEKIIEYIGINITSDNNDQKHAAFSAFYSIIETSHKDKLFPLVADSLTLIFGQLQNAKSPDHLKEISALLIYQICEFFGDFIYKQPDLFDKLLSTIVSLLTTQKKKVVVSLCNSIHYLVKSMNLDLTQSTNILTKSAHNILNQLYTLAFAKGSYNTDDNVAITSCLAIGTIIERLAFDCQILKQQFFKIMIKAFDSTLIPSQYENDQQRYDYQQYITAILTALVITTNLDEEDLIKCFNSLIESFNERKCIYEEGIAAIGSLSISLKAKFDEYMQKFAPFLFMGLKSVNEHSLCRISLQAACDLIGNFGSLISNYIGEIINIAIQILSDNNVDRRLKLFSFNVISDLFCYMPQDALVHFINVMTLIGSAMEAAKTIPNKGDEIDTTGYALQLREHLVETLISVFSSIEDYHKTVEFFPYVQPIISFVLEINSDDISPSFELMKSSISIISDFCKAYGKKIQGFLNVDIIYTMINKLIEQKESLSEKENLQMDDLIKWAKNQISSVLI